MTTAFPPGWYPDATQPQTLRYWDGNQFTDQRAPMQEALVEALTAAQTQQPQPTVQPSRPQAPVDDREKVASNVEVVGWITAVLVPIVGFIIGLTQINKRGGLPILLASLCFGFLWGLIAYQITRPALEDTPVNELSYSDCIKVVDVETCLSF